MTGFVMRQCWDFDNVETLKSVYFALVRSLLEYCSIVWSPFYKTHIDRIERVQSRFVNFLLYKININPHMLAYPEWLRLIGLESLESRHNHLSLSFGHKILNNSVNSPELLGLINFRVPSRPTRQQELFSLNHSRTDIGKNNPINQMMRLFNKLPFDFDLNCSLNSFKNKLKKLYIWLIHASFRTLFTFFFYVMINLIKITVKYSLLCFKRDICSLLLFVALYNFVTLRSMCPILTIIFYIG